MTDAKSIVLCCNATMGPGKEGEYMVRRFIWLIDNTNIAPYQDCCTLTGSSELHSFRSYVAGSWSIHTQKMASYFPSCVEENWDDCESIEWVDKWDIRVLDPIDTYRPPQALEMVQMESSIDFDCLSDLVQPSNIYIYISL